MGHVFHPGHDALHGITVVLETGGGRTYIGRFDTRDATAIHLLDVAVHDAAATTLPKDEFVRHSARFGVRADLKQLSVPVAEVERVTPLGEIAS